MDKELLKKLQELKKSHLNFTAEREMEFVMQNRDNEGGNFSTTTNSAVHSEDNRSSKFDGKPTLTDLAEAPSSSFSRHCEKTGDDGDDFGWSAINSRRRSTVCHYSERYKRLPEDQCREDRRSPMRESSSQLPKMKMKVFDGNPLDWPEWSSMLIATVYKFLTPDPDK